MLNREKRDEKKRSTNENFNTLGCQLQKKVLIKNDHI